jgi:hypothetical protein
MTCGTHVTLSGNVEVGDNSGERQGGLIVHGRSVAGGRQWQSGGKAEVTTRAGRAWEVSGGWENTGGPPWVARNPLVGANTSCKSRGWRS